MTRLCTFLALLSLGCGDITVAPSPEPDAGQPEPVPDQTTTPFAVVGTPCEASSDCVGAVCNLECVAGRCAELTCDDGDPCTKESVCTGAACVGAVDCDDGDPCTTGDRCEAGECVSEAVSCEADVVCEGDARVTYQQQCSGASSCERTPGAAPQRDDCPFGCDGGVCKPAPEVVSVSAAGVFAAAQAMTGGGLSVEVLVTAIDGGVSSSESFSLSIGL